jgi:hypothetical protein
MTTLLIVSGIILFIIIAMLAVRKPASYDSDTTSARNGISYQRDKNPYTRNN